MVGKRPAAFALLINYTVGIIFLYTHISLLPIAQEPQTVYCDSLMQDCGNASSGSLAPVDAGGGNGLRSHGLMSMGNTSITRKFILSSPSQGKQESKSL